METGHNKYAITEDEIKREVKSAYQHIRQANKGIGRVKPDGWNIRVTDWGYALQVCYFDGNGVLNVYNVAM